MAEAGWLATAPWDAEAALLELQRDITITAALAPSPWAAALVPAWGATFTPSGWAADIQETTMRHDSVEYLHIPVTAPAGTTVTSDPVEVSFDGANTWHPATWSGSEALVLVGPGTAVGKLPQGYLPVLVRVTDSPERPVLEAGSLTID